MKKIIFLLILPLLAASQNSKLEENNGFENFIFGSPSADYKNLILEIAHGDTKLYSSTPEINVSGVDFSDVNITFLKNKLCTICLKTKNSTGIKLLEIFKQNYGQPTRYDDNRGNYEWQSDKIQLVYELNRAATDATVSFYSKEIYEREKKK